MNNCESIFELCFFIEKKGIDCVFLKKTYEFLRME